LILGSSTSIDGVIRQEETTENQLNDLKLTYICPSQWLIEGSVGNATSYDPVEHQIM